MKSILMHLFGFAVRMALRLRYKITFKNKSELKKPKLKKGGYLILPNHPAEVDPIIMMAHLWPKFKLHPLVVEHFFYFPGARFFMNAVGAIPIPNFESTVNRWKVEKGEKAFEEVLERLKRGENLLVYPSGGLKGSSRDIVTGSSFVHNLLTEYPEINIVMVRMQGLWGSSFSRAIIGRTPDFWKALRGGIWTILKNFIFFAPRRKVSVEFYNPGEEFPYKGQKFEQNIFLQNWYNHYQDAEGNAIEEEPLVLTPRSLFNKNDIPQEVAALNRVIGEKREIEISSQMQSLIIDKVAEMSEKSPSEIGEDSDLSVDLGLDSLDIANVYAYVTEEFDVTSKVEPGELRSVHDLFELAVDEKRSENPQTEKSKMTGWPEEASRKGPIPPQGSTIVEAFLLSCDRMGSSVACADANSGVMTYQRMKLAALVLAAEFRKLPGEYVGVMLPSSAGVYLMILGVLMAGKIPVMLNWTAGIRSLRYGVDLLNIETILSSRKFLDRMEHLHLEELESKLLLVEDVRRKVSVFDKLKAAMKARKDCQSLMKSLKLREKSSHDPAVVLFTSGTEAYPKAVPLSSANILASQQGAVGRIELNEKDILYGVLPPFHSFGFCVTGLLPLLAGLRVYYSPDPTDGHAMANDAEKWGITMMCLAPSFYKNLLRLAGPKQLRSIRYFISGAEKASDDLKIAIKRQNPDAEFFEGYGITECSPIVSICKPGANNKGVGRAAPGVHLCVIHPETHKIMPQGQDGEICIKGPNVFYGYIGEAKRDPFITIDGNKWYRSGDLGHVDREGNLILGGRIKRFVKIGGEMVSLASIEEELIAKGIEKEWVDQESAPTAFVLCANEIDDGKPHIVLFTTCRVQKEEINQILRDSGFGRIMKISEVKVLPEIPLLGSGKIDYRRLNEMVKE
ncbi:MAG: AMP-binding protein [Simkaniaceae bacterium]|nr:AMP-binding protein [Simkaniaceae bacterium]